MFRKRFTSLSEFGGTKSEILSICQTQASRIRLCDMIYSRRLFRISSCVCVKCLSENAAIMSYANPSLTLPPCRNNCKRVACVTTRKNWITQPKLRGGWDRLFNYWGGRATLRGQQLKNNVALEMNLTAFLCVCTVWQRHNRAVLTKHSALGINLKEAFRVTKDSAD